MPTVDKESGKKAKILIHEDQGEGQWCNDDYDVDEVVNNYADEDNDKDVDEYIDKTVDGDVECVDPEEKVDLEVNRQYPGLEEKHFHVNFNLSGERDTVARCDGGIPMSQGFHREAVGI